MKFRTILADPPWQYDNYHAAVNGAACSHYSCMTDKMLERLPVACIAEENAALLLWCTWPKLEAGIRLVNAWGFRYVSGFPWIKMQAPGVERRGIGFHSLGASEFVLIGIRGSGMTPAVEDRQIGVIFSPIGAHSAKPDEQYRFAEAYGGPFLEMFARPDGGLDEPSEHWTRIGNEMPGCGDIADDLCRLASLPQPDVRPVQIDALDRIVSAQENLGL